MGGGYFIYMLLGAVGTIVGMILSARLKSKFNHYSQISNQLPPKWQRSCRKNAP
jgi:uncharacterized membrane protein YeaQ/YmgE (transglycosylase-associated protein family)